METSNSSAAAIERAGGPAALVEVEIKPDKDPSPSNAPGSDTGPPPCADQSLECRIEALMLCSDRPVSESKLAELLGLSGAGTTKAIREAIDDLNRQYAKSGRSFRIEKLAGGWQILTLAQFGPLLARMHTERQASRLSHAALETLSIIAYRQPLIRAEIEAIRGVACGEVLRGLLERRLVKIVGRAEELGRPMLYGTTREFLKVFGLSSLDDLPDVEGLDPKAMRRKSAAPQAKAEEPDDEDGTNRPGPGDEVEADGAARD
jgi:segregation and condensation protein B